MYYYRRPTTTTTDSNSNSSRPLHSLQIMPPAPVSPPPTYGAISGFSGEKAARVGTGNGIPKCTHYGGKTPVWIAVMGVTGAGKSTFIATLSGQHVEIGHNLNSCTEGVSEFSFPVKNSCVHLIDTPGFDDTNKKDAETLQTISNYLAESYEANIRLSAIIYIHSIHNTRMVGSALSNFKMFRSLCGEDPLKNIILATNFWEQLPTQEIGEGREKQLRDEFWSNMVRRGSKIVRFYKNDREGALRIIEQYLENEPIALKIQTEIVVEKKNLIDTQAGSSLNEELVRLQKEHSAQLLRVQEELAEAIRQKDDEFQEILEAERKETSQKLDALKEAQQKLREDSARAEERLKAEVERERQLAEMKERHMDQKIEASNAKHEETTRAIQEAERRHREELDALEARRREDVEAADRRVREKENEAVRREEKFIAARELENQRFLAALEEKQHEKELEAKRLKQEEEMKAAAMEEKHQFELRQLAQEVKADREREERRRIEAENNTRLEAERRLAIEREERIAMEQRLDAERNQRQAIEREQAATERRLTEERLERERVERERAKTAQRLKEESAERERLKEKNEYARDRGMIRGVAHGILNGLGKNFR